MLEAAFKSEIPDHLRVGGTLPSTDRMVSGDVACLGQRLAGVCGCSCKSHPTVRLVVWASRGDCSWAQELFSMRVRKAPALST